MLAHHKHHPQQIHWVVQVAIIPIFRYSAALAGWKDQDIQDLSATIVHRCGSNLERPRHGWARGTAPLTNGPGKENYDEECGAAPL